MTTLSGEIDLKMQIKSRFYLEVSMKTAEELYEISKSKVPEIVANILDGVKEHVTQRCEQEANQGGTYYSINLKRGYHFVKGLLLEKCIDIAKEFEHCGYKVSIEGKDNDCYVDFVMTFSWDGKINKVKDNHAYLGYKVLYTTDNGDKNKVYEKSIKTQWNYINL